MTQVKKRILVLGGTGFIGRHAVLALQACDCLLTIGSRTPEQFSHLPKLSYTEVHFETLLNPQDWLPILENIDIVLNCVGILRPSGKATYDKVHHLAPLALSNACAEKNIRFIHVSALGLNNQNKSGFLSSKLKGEEAIKQTTANWIIARPSLLDGEGGYGAAWLRGIALLPVFVAPADALGKIAALNVNDLGEALTNLCLKSSVQLKLEQSREFELGGISAYNFSEYILGLRFRDTKKTAVCIKIPGWLARLGAHLCDLFNVTPFSFGHWELLRKDNVPKPNRLPELLERKPIAVIEE